MRKTSILGLAASSLFVTTALHAAPVWVGDFEAGNLDEWNFKLFPEYTSIVDSPTIHGTKAARIELDNAAEWSNGLRRVELHHSPAEGRTDEGAETYFAWSFYLPETLPTDPSHQIGYWESDNSYQQMMAFQVEGEHISFSTRRPQNNVQWQADNLATAGVWHRIALHIKWSKNAAQGYVDVWFDGIQVVTQGAAQTLADDNSHFTQVGLLRGDEDFQDKPVIIIDDAVEGDSLADVRPELTTNEGGAGGGTSTTTTSTSAGTGGESPTNQGSGASGGSSGSGGSGGAPSGEEDSGCRFVAPSDVPSRGVLGLYAVAAIAIVRRRLTSARR